LADVARCAFRNQPPPPEANSHSWAEPTWQQETARLRQLLSLERIVETVLRPMNMEAFLTALCVDAPIDSTLLAQLHQQLRAWSATDAVQTWIRFMAHEPMTRATEASYVTAWSNALRNALRNALTRASDPGKAWTAALKLLEVCMTYPWSGNDLYLQLHEPWPETITPATLPAWFLRTAMGRERCAAWRGQLWEVDRIHALWMWIDAIHDEEVRYVALSPFLDHMRRLKKKKRTLTADEEGEEGEEGEEVEEEEEYELSLQEMTTKVLSELALAVERAHQLPANSI